MCWYPERALSVSYLGTLCCIITAKAALLLSEDKCPEKNKLGAGSNGAI